MTAPKPDRLADLHALCFTVPRPWNAAEITALLGRRGVFLIGDDKTGFALGRTVAQEVELLTLAVNPAQRRKGIARALLAAYEAEALSRGAEDSFLDVAADNTAALNLYAQAGYRESGRRTGYFRTATGARIDALTLHKPLKPA